MADTKEGSGFTFAQQLWDCFPAVYTRVSRGRHDLKAVKAYLEVRAKLELDYSKKLDAAAATIAEFTEPTSLGRCWLSMRDGSSQISKQHHAFSNLCSELAKSLEVTISELKSQKGKVSVTQASHAFGSCFLDARQQRSLGKRSQHKA